MGNRVRSLIHLGVVGIKSRLTVRIQEFRFSSVYPRKETDRRNQTLKLQRIRIGFITSWLLIRINIKLTTLCQDT